MATHSSAPDGCHLAPSDATAENQNRKQNHCEIEKRRRDKMNNYITELASVIPAFNSNSSKLDKLTVLRIAVQHVKSLRSSLCSFSSFHLRPSFLSSGNLLKNLILQVASLEARDNLFVVVTCDTGKVLFVSKSSRDILNQEQDELVGQCLFDMLHKDDVSKVKEQITHFDVAPNKMLVDSKTLQPIRRNQRQSFLQLQNQSNNSSSTLQPGARRSFFCRMRRGADSACSPPPPAQPCESLFAPEEKGDQKRAQADGQPVSGGKAGESAKENAQAVGRHNKSPGEPERRADAHKKRSRDGSSSKQRKLEEERQRTQSMNRTESNGGEVSRQRRADERASLEHHQRATGKADAAHAQQTRAGSRAPAAEGAWPPAAEHGGAPAPAGHADELWSCSAASSSLASSSSSPPMLTSCLAGSLCGSLELDASQHENCAAGSAPTCKPDGSAAMGLSQQARIQQQQQAAAGSHDASCNSLPTARQMGAPDRQAGASVYSRKQARYIVLHCTGYLKPINLRNDEYDDDHDDDDDEAAGTDQYDERAGEWPAADNKLTSDYENEASADEFQRPRSTSNTFYMHDGYRTVNCLVAVCRRSVLDRDLKPDRPFTFTCRYSMEGKFVFVDQRTTVALGYTPQQLIGTSHYAYCHKDSVNTFKECHRQCILKSETVSSDIYQFKRANGQHLWLQTSLKSFRNPWTKLIDYIVANHTTAEGSDTPRHNEACVPTKFSRARLALQPPASLAPGNAHPARDSPSSLVSVSVLASASSVSPELSACSQGSSSSLGRGTKNSPSSSSPRASSIGSSYSMESCGSGVSVQALLNQIDRVKSGGPRHELEFTSKKQRVRDACPQPRDLHHHHHHHHHHHNNTPSSMNQSSEGKSNQDSGNFSDLQSCSSISSRNSNASNVSGDYLQMQNVSDFVEHAASRQVAVAAAHEDLGSASPPPPQPPQLDQAAGADGLAPFGDDQRDKQAGRSGQEAGMSSEMEPASKQRQECSQLKSFYAEQESFGPLRADQAPICVAPSGLAAGELGQRAPATSATSEPYGPEGGQPKQQPAEGPRMMNVRILNGTRPLLATSIAIKPLQSYAPYQYSYRPPPPPMMSTSAPNPAVSSPRVPVPNWQQVQQRQPQQRPQQQQQHNPAYAPQVGACAQPKGHPAMEAAMCVPMSTNTVGNQQQQDKQEQQQRTKYIIQHNVHQHESHMVQMSGQMDDFGAISMGYTNELMMHQQYLPAEGLGYQLMGQEPQALEGQSQQQLESSMNMTMEPQHLIGQQQQQQAADLMVPMMWNASGHHEQAAYEQQRADGMAFQQQPVGLMGMGQEGGQMMQQQQHTHQACSQCAGPKGGGQLGGQGVGYQYDQAASNDHGDLNNLHLSALGADELDESELLEYLAACAPEAQLYTTQNSSYPHYDGV